MSRRFNSKCPFPTCHGLAEDGIVLQLSPLSQYVRTIFFNAGPLATLDEDDSIINGKAIIVNNDVITAIADSVEVVEEFKSSDSTFVDVSGRAIIPGLIDAHNHLLWAGDRFNEHKLRMDGMTYSEIAATGGGIMPVSYTHLRAHET